MLSVLGAISAFGYIARRRAVRNPCDSLTETSGRRRAQNKAITASVTAVRWRDTEVRRGLLAMMGARVTSLAALQPAKIGGGEGALIKLTSKNDAVERSSASHTACMRRLNTKGMKRRGVREI